MRNHGLYFVDVEYAQKRNTDAKNPLDTEKCEDPTLAVSKLPR